LADNKIRDKILKDAKIEADRIIAEAREESDKILSEVKKQVSEIENEKWDGESTLILSQRDVNRFGENIFDEILRKLAVGKKIKKEVANFEGGCILKKEKYEFNATIDTILDNLKERLETKLAHLLFD